MPENAASENGAISFTFKAEADETGDTGNNDNNDIMAKIGSSAIVDITKDDVSDGSVNVNAYSGSNTRIIAGALSVAPLQVQRGLRLRPAGRQG